MVGVMAVEYALTLVVSMGAITAIAEFYRLSLMEQALARATHLAVRASSAEPWRCMAAAQEAFEADGLASWLLDRNSDGSIGFVTGTDPDGTSDSEVRIDITADGTISDGVAFTSSLCGSDGAWINLRATVAVRASFSTNPVLLTDESWAMNQE